MVCFHTNKFPFWDVNRRDSVGNILILDGGSGLVVTHLVGVHPTDTHPQDTREP